MITHDAGAQIEQNIAERFFINFLSNFKFFAHSNLLGYAGIFFPITETFHHNENVKIVAKTYFTNVRKKSNLPNGLSKSTIFKERLCDQ